MKLALLLTADVPQIPADIAIVRHWGEVEVDIGGEQVAGTHVLVDGSDQAIYEWVKDLPYIWRQKGLNPRLRVFEKVHAPDNLTFDENGETIRC